jgi:homoserine O-succinyltransferase
MNKHLKIAILDMYDGYPNEGMRCIKMLVDEFLSKENRKGNFDVFNVRGANDLPDLNDYDIYISTGGPGSPVLEGHEWETLYCKFLDSLLAHNSYNYPKKYLFFICHSFQLAIQHFGFGIITKRKSTSFGVMPVHFTGEGASETVFNGLEDPFWAVDSRDYQFIEPDAEAMIDFGAKIVAIEKKRPHIPLERAVMAIRFTDEVFGTQFHPEADAEGMRRYFLQADKKKAVIDEHGEEKFDEMIEHLEDPDKIMLTESVMIPTFLKNATNAILNPEMA